MYMKTARLIVIVFSVISLSSAVVPSRMLAKEIVLGADIFCPYNCETLEDPQSEFPGYIVELLHEIARQQAIDLKIVKRPATRIVVEMQSGTLQGTISVFSTKDVTSFGAKLQPCFVTRKDNPWEFNGPDSLLDICLGLVPDYGSAQWVMEHAEKYHDDDTKIQWVRGEEPLVQNLKKIVAKRIDATRGDAGAILWAAKQHQLDAELKLVGCGDPSILRAIGFAENFAEKQAYIDLFNKGYAALEESGRVQQLLDKYGLQKP